MSGAPSHGQKELAIGITGLGGWAGTMFDALAASHGSPDEPVRLAVVCEPHPERFPHRVDWLRRHDIPVVRALDELLSKPIEAVYLPLPIALHRPYTERALAAGKAVLCEKPAAGCVADVDAMIAARDRAGLPALIGFKDVYQPAVQQIKRRLCAGEFGAVREARIIGCWPRGERYYRRTEWAGKIRHNGRYVLDTPANNAFSHYIHLAMFLLGEFAGESAAPSRVEAELYRVNRIETYDTCSLQITLESGVPIYVGLTHACTTSIEPEVTIITQKARIRYLNADSIEILPNHRGDAAVERLPFVQPLHLPMFQNFRDCVLGGPGQNEVGTLEMARAHAMTVAAASSASEVVDVPREFTCVVADADGGVGVGARTVIRNIEHLLRASVGNGQLLHDSGLAAWSCPSGKSSAATTAVI